MKTKQRFLGICRILLFLLIAQYTFAQRGNVWIFGDSARLDFNQPGAVLRANSWASATSSTVCDTSGNLLFYVVTPVINGQHITKVFNSNNTPMQGSAQMLTIANPLGVEIIPWPGNDSLYYIFYQFTSPSGSNPPGIYYSIVNMADPNNGIVIQQNVLLYAKRMNGSMALLQHGNGRDWWLYFGMDTLNASGSAILPNNTIYRALITPDGITPVYKQNIGTPTYSSGEISFNKQGTKVAIGSITGKIEMFDVDRCTGFFSNPQLIYPPNNIQPDFHTWKLEFSENSRFLYALTIHSADTFIVDQIDLQNSSPYFNRIQIAKKVYPYGIHYISRWLDDKLYLVYFDGTVGLNDTLLTPLNSYLGVINFPNNLGLACQYNPMGLYLNGARSAGGLPNNPEYNSGVLAGSICDTLTTSLSELDKEEIELTVYPNPATEEVTVYAAIPFAASCTIELYTAEGKLVGRQEFASNFSNCKFNLNKLSEGMYTIILSTDSGRIAKKFVKME